MLFSSASPRQRIVTRAGVAGEEQRGLTGRVAGADDVDVEPVRVGRLAAGRAVVDALADQPVDARDREVPPGHAGGEDDRARAQLVAAVEVDLSRARVDAGDRARDQDLRAQAARLLERALASSSPETPAGKPR